MTDAEREANWPFEEERVKIQNDYQQIYTLTDQLQGSSANLTDIRNAEAALECTVTADFGLLGRS